MNAFVAFGRSFFYDLWIYYLRSRIIFINFLHLVSFLLTTMGCYTLYVWVYFILNNSVAINWGIFLPFYCRTFLLSWREIYYCQVINKLQMLFSPSVWYCQLVLCFGYFFHCMGNPILESFFSISNWGGEGWIMNIFWYLQKL